MKIFCIGRNYLEHAKELNNAVPSKPLFFMKPPSSLLRKNKHFYHPEFSKEIHYEVELVLRICKNGRHIAEKFAHKYYDQIGVGIDFTARDLQNECKKKGHPWEIAKAFDKSAPLGDKFIPKEQFADLQNINFSLQKNGATVQSGNTKDLIFSFDKIIAYLSQFFILEMHDLIFTGTPAGVGPITVGDKLEAFIEDERLLGCEIR